jgi:hypothetical protein
VQAAPVTLQCAGRSGHSAGSEPATKHEAPLFEQCPGWVGQSARSVPAVWQMLPTRLQWPASVHGPVSTHVCAVSMLQCPGRVGHSAGSEPAVWQAARICTLQFPASTQSWSTKQPGVPSFEQVPGCVGQSPAAPVQALPRRLQVPVLGQVAAVSQPAPLLLHVPGGHVTTGVHTGHSPPVHGQTWAVSGWPSANHEVVQVSGFGGIQLGATRLQVWVWTLLHVCPAILTQVCGVALQVCGSIPSQVWGPVGLQVCVTSGRQVCGVSLQICVAGGRQVCAVPALHESTVAPLQVCGVPALHV